jgi:proteasome assembly chaperone (PAC2) family protein
LISSTIYCGARSLSNVFSTAETARGSYNFGMTEGPNELLRLHDCPSLSAATLLLAFDGWMDGGDVSTGTVRGLVNLFGARAVAEIDPEPFLIYNFPGSMEVAALFRPALKIEDGLITTLRMPANVFYCHEPARLFLFVGREPHLRWRTFADCVLEFARRAGVARVLFVGSFGGSVPHTRQPRLHVTCSEARLLPEMEKYGVRRVGYEGPGSFASYLLTRAPVVGLEMTSLAAEIPGYLQGRNPVCIEAVTRKLSQVLRLPVDLAPLRTESIEWEVQVSQLVAKDRDLSRAVRRLEEAYDEELLRQAEDGES